MTAPRIHLISGKGGVGKSTVAMARSLDLVSSGRRVLLVELGERSYFKFLIHQDLGQVPKHLNELGLSMARFDGEACLEEYVYHYVRLQALVRVFFDNKISGALINAAPALKELAILGKITATHRKIGVPLDFDDIVVDGYATGHFRALLRAPRGMAEAIPFGPMGEQSREINRVLVDPTITSVILVSLPEELPVNETSELLIELKQEFGMQAQVILNKMLGAISAHTLQQAAPKHESARLFLAAMKRKMAMQETAMTRLLNLTPAVQSCDWIDEQEGLEIARRISFKKLRPQ